MPVASQLLLEPIYGWKLLLTGGGWLLLAAMLFWLTRDEAAWQGFWKREPRAPARRNWRLMAWCCSALGFILIVGSLSGSHNAADLGGCTWLFVVSGLASAATTLIVKAYRSST